MTMNECHARLESVGAICAAERDRMLGALKAQGVELSMEEPQSAAGALLVCFDRVTDEAVSYVAERPKEADGRVIAILLVQDEISNRDVWRLVEAGAGDVIVWKGQAEPARAIAERVRRWAEVEEVVDSPLVADNLIGRSLAWKTAMRQVVEAGRYTDVPVLIMGESGTGKELAARPIHTLDSRPRKGELVVVDCSTVTPELSGSEFFGHERGAFTHALNVREGAFALADEGTLFLDEVGELPLALQAELLRVIQERTYKRLGSNSWKKAAFRLVCATNRTLEDEVQQRAFRRDLYHRLAGCVCRLPPLRERREDILLLCSHFLRNHYPEGEVPEFDGPVRDCLLAREYSGNARELRHLIGRIAGRHVGSGPITVGDLPPEERKGLATAARTDWRSIDWENVVRRALSSGVTLKELREGVSDLAIRLVVEAEGGSLSRASRKLGVTDRALQLRQAARRQAHSVSRTKGSNGATPRM